MAGTTGIRTRHRKGCRNPAGGRCNCSPAYEAWVYVNRDRRKVRKTFDSRAEAKAWRAEASTAAAKGSLRAAKRTTIKQAWEAWYAAAQDGAIRNRSGQPFKPSSLRAYEQAMRLHVLPELGGTRLASLHRPDLQRFTRRMEAAGSQPSTVRGAILPLRAIYKHAVEIGDLAVNPTAGLSLPASQGGRDRIATPAEAQALLSALPETRDRALWATALYAGLRLGELQALRWKDIDLAGGVIRVEHGWDAKEGAIGPKSVKGRRRVPIPAILRAYLAEHLLDQGRPSGPGLAFGSDAKRAFCARTMTSRADVAWRKAGLSRITPHECRHTFASLMIAAGVNAKALSTYMGHANISITLDLYGHLMPGSETEAADLLDTYLDGAIQAGTGASTGASAGE